VASLRGVPFGSLDRVASGARVVVERANGSTAADMIIPSGPYGGPGTAGWSLNASGTVWIYLDKTARPPNGIKKIVLRDLSLTVPGHIQIKVASAASGSYPIVAADLPPMVTLELGAPDRCVQTGFAATDCLLRAVGTAVCKTQ
jgi:hypothetical protein